MCKWSVDPVAKVTLSNSGKFCRSFGPESPSSTSFGVTPFGARSMPRPPLE